MKILAIFLALLSVDAAEAKDYPLVRRAQPPWNWALVDADGKVVIGYDGKPREGMDNVACIKISQSYPGSKCVQQ